MIENTTTLATAKKTEVVIKENRKRKLGPTEKILKKNRLKNGGAENSEVVVQKPKVKIIYKIIKAPSFRLPYEVDVDDSHFSGVSLSLTDCSPHLYVSSDALVVHGSAENGYSLVRSSQGVGNGTSYWEAIVLPPVNSDNESFVRIGWATRLADTFSFVGSDIHGFGYGNQPDGCLLHNRHRQDGYGAKYGPGDVIGVMCNVCTGVGNQPNHIRFFVNGQDQGPAFENNIQLSSGSTLFAAVSIYRQARVRVNFGPSFLFPLHLLVWKSSEARVLLANCLAVSELKPLSLNERLVHDRFIVETRDYLRSIKQMQSL